jgi:hypothetical protein
MTDPIPEPRPPSQLQEGRSFGALEWTMLVLAAVIAGGGLAFWFLRPAPVPPAPPLLAPPEAAAPPVAPAPTGPAPAPAPVAPGDATLALLEAISASKDYRSWLAQGDVLNRWAVVTDNLAEGVSPRRALEHLAPAQPFTVAQRGALTVIAPESYRRYDRFAGAVASVDVRAFAAAYRALHPVLEAAWRALGDPHGSLDETAARALGRLAAAPVVEGDVAVEPAGPLLYLFADPALEALGAVEKHLLRMGPRNARLVKRQAAALQQALGLPPPQAARPAPHR